MSSSNESDRLEDPKSHEESAVKEQLYKVLVIGDFGVGKVSPMKRSSIQEAIVSTSIIRRYTEDEFSPNYKLTIGVDFSLKTLEWDDKTKVSLQLWDIAGHERFWHMTRVYYKYAIAAIIVFDLTRPVTFDSVSKWLGDVNQKVVLENGEPVPILLLANKCDADNVQVDTSKLDDFCSKYNIAGWFSTSAKENINIDNAMNFIVRKILYLATHKSESPEETEFVDLGDNTNSEVLKPDHLNAYATDNSVHLNGYANVAKINGLVGLSPNHDLNKDQTIKSKSSCC